MLPFNIWFFFVSLPFRFFFFATSFFYSTKKPIAQVKQKIAVIKDEINDTLPESLKSKAPIELRARKPRGAFDEERPFHGFYAVEKKEEHVEEKGARRNSLSKKETPVQSAPAESSPAKSTQSDEIETLRSKLAEMEQRSQKTSDDKMKLEQQLEELGKKFESDETALSQVESERKRYKSLISVEQRKCFDFQQQIVELKNQLKKEHDAADLALKMSAESKKQPEVKNKSKKEKKKSSAPTPAPTPAPSAAATQPEQHSAWHGATHTQDYTDLVAKAQREEIESGKTFSEVLKESIKPAEPSLLSTKKTDEFTVVGGADSNHHVFAPVSAV